MELLIGNFYSLKESRLQFCCKRLINEYDGYKEYECMVRKYPQRIITYYLTHKSNFWSKDDWHFKIFIGRIGTIIGGLWKLKTVYTENSIKQALRNMPTVRDYVLSHGHYKSEYIISSGLDFEGGSLCIVLPKWGKDISEYTINNKVDVLVEFADKVINEFVYQSIVTSDLVKISHTTNPELPSWIKEGINGIVRIGVRTVGSMIGANLDGDFNIGDVQVGDIDFDLGDWDIDANIDGDYDVDFNSDGIVETNNIAFLGKQTPSFDTGNDVHIVCETGTDKGYFDVYLQNGNKYIKIGNGSSNNWSNWVSIQGKNSFSWNGNKYYIK